MLYLQAITVRKMVENGQEKDLPTNPRVLDMLRIINDVKRERYEKRNYNK